MQRVEEFLANNKHDRRWRGGMLCSICASEHARKIEADLRAFVKAKKAGHEMPWAVFQRKRLTPLYGLKVGTNTVLKHVRACLGLDA